MMIETRFQSLHISKRTRTELSTLRERVGMCVFVYLHDKAIINDDVVTNNDEEVTLKCECNGKRAMPLELRTTPT